MMTRTRELALCSFENKLVDGLLFCHRVYDLFDQIRGGPDGIARLRLRCTKTEKRLIEELIPIAYYVQARYNEGRRIKVKWVSESRPYDAILWSAGPSVEHRYAPRRVVVEVTTSAHKNEYLTRQALNERGGSFGAKRIYRDKKSGEIVSKPYVYSGNERMRELVQQISDRLKAKAQKKYPTGTVLILNCVPTSLILEPEWDEVVQELRTTPYEHPFREIFLIEGYGHRFATLYGSASAQRRNR